MKGYPFEVQLDLPSIRGAILSDQAKSLDWKARNAKFICKAPPEVIEEALAKLNSLLKPS